MISKDLNGQGEGMMAKKIIFIIYMIGLFASICGASTTGKLEGTVTDNSGNPLEKVKISIISVNVTSRKFNIQTKKDGKFIQIGIIPGYYQISFSKSGFAPISKEVRVRMADTTRLEVRMEESTQMIERNLSGSDKLFLSGNKLYEENKLEEAISAYTEAIALNATQWGYYFNLGLAFKKKENREASIGAFQEALKLNPESYSCYRELGEALAQSEEYEKAKTFYLKASELSPDDPDAFYNLGVVLTNLGNTEEALKYFLRAVGIQDDYADAYYQIGTIYIGKAQTAEAVKNLEKFLWLAPEHPNAKIAKQLLEYLKK